MNTYYDKYIKYKKKYMDLKNNFYGGSGDSNKLDDHNKYKFTNIEFIGETPDEYKFKAGNDATLIILKNTDSRMLDRYLSNERIFYIMNKEDSFFAKPYEIQRCDDININKNTKSICRTKKQSTMINNPINNVYFLETKNNTANIINIFHKIFEKEINTGLNDNSGEKMNLFIKNYISMLHIIENKLKNAFEKKGFIHDNLQFSTITVNNNWNPNLYDYSGSRINEKYNGNANFIDKYFMSFLQFQYHINELMKNNKDSKLILLGNSTVDNLKNILALFYDNFKIQYIKKKIENHQAIIFSELN